MSEAGPATASGERLGILLMTFGSAVTSADVPAYLRSVRGGRDASGELVAEFERRFDVIGRSPLIEITVAQAAGLEARLNGGRDPRPVTVAAGMLHSAPHIATALRCLVEAGATEEIGRASCRERV